MATHSSHPSEQDVGDQICAGASESYVFTSQHLTYWGQKSQGPGRSCTPGATKTLQPRTSWPHLAGQGLGLGQGWEGLSACVCT